MPDCIIRELKSEETYLLKDFLYEALFQRDEHNLLPRNIIDQPELKIYIDGFGKPDDCCLVADMNGTVIGAVWTRILSGKIKGFGYVDEHTPEFAISLYKQYRNRGIGTLLIKSMLNILKKRGYTKTSLAVQKDNYAVNMYKKCGFTIIKELDQEYLMVCDLQ